MGRRSKRNLSDASEHTFQACSVPPTKTRSSSDLANSASQSLEPDGLPDPAPKQIPRPDFAYGRYQRLGELGRGGWGIVERVVDRQLGREVAIKRIVHANRLSELDRERFLHEARVTSQLQHPGVVPVHELGQECGEIYYVMKLLEGDTLRKHIRRIHRERSESSSRKQKPLTEWIAPLLERFIDVCHAVAYAHDNNIIHRDLKPTNVMVGAFGETVVVDWGLAREPGSQDSDESTLAGSSKSSSRISESDGTVVGTPAYMAPEQARGEISAIGPHSDIYSLGVILYEIIVGRHPYAGMKIDAVLQHVKAGTVKPIEEAIAHLPKPLIRIVQTAMQSDASARYASAENLADDVRRFLTGDKVSVHQESWLDHAARWCRRNRSLAATGAIAGTIILALSIGFGWVIHLAHRNEQRARIQAQQAHREALARLVDARDAADAWLIDLSGSLEFHPSLAPLKQDLFDQAIDQYSTLIESSDEAGLDADGETLAYKQVERAKCHLRLGDLYRLGGDRELARDHYRLASRALAPLSSDAPQSTRVSLNPSNRTSTSRFDSAPTLADHVKLESIHAMLGTWLAGSDTPNEPRLAESRSWLADWLPTQNHFQNSARTFRDVPEFSARVIATAVRLELALNRSHEKTDESPSNVLLLQTSPPQLERAVLLAKWLASHRGKPRDQALSQTAQLDLIRSLESSGNDKQLAEAWSRLIQDLTDWTDTSRPRCDHLQSLGHARMSRGQILERLNQPAKAAEDYRSAINDLNHAWALSDSDAFYRINLAAAETNLGRLIAHSDGAQDEAIPMLRRAVATYQSVLRERTTPSILRRLAQSHLALADLLTGQSKDRTSNLQSAALAFEILSDHGSLEPSDQLLWDRVTEMLHATDTESQATASPPSAPNP